MDTVGIKLVSVSARFHHRVKGEVYAARDVSLDVQPGELLTLLGPSGCGKTTTLRMIAGFQKPSDGTIYIGERDVTQVMANERDIGFVFQNYALFPHLNVYENVAYGLRVRRKSEDELGKAVGDVLALVGLKGYERQMPHQLSGGEQQRVALARAIVIKPRVLLFDEPLSNLDAKLRVQMRGEIQRLQKTLGITTVYVTHDQEEAMAISDRIAVMDKGRIVQFGTADQLYRRPATVFVAGFIGRANLIEVMVREVAAGRVAVEIAGVAQMLEGTWDGLRAGVKTLAVLRPEAVGLGTPGAAGTIPGIVRSRVYLGEKAEYVVEAGGQSLLIVRFEGENERFVPGASVSVRLPARDVQLLTGGDA
ncbi:MAG: ABC transporter ATP-binding protein [Chloroflexi bacterium]|nr:ABC transporter ATP-binding protein [Chloroflexota bacterium]